MHHVLDAVCTCDHISDLTEMAEGGREEKDVKRGEKKAQAVLGAVLGRVRLLSLFWLDV